MFLLRPSHAPTQRYYAPADYGYGYAPSPFLVQSPRPTARERYLRALEEEEAVRTAYAREVQRRAMMERLAGARDGDDDDGYRYPGYDSRRRPQPAAAYGPVPQRRAAGPARQRAASPAECAAPDAAAARIPISTRDSPAREPAILPSPRPASPALPAAPPSTPDIADTASDTDSVHDETPDTAAALATIANIGAALAAQHNAFVFPEALDADATGSGLAYTARNKPVRAHEEALARLLAALDAVPSGGARAVRAARRAVVQDVEAELAALDARVQDALRAQQAVPAQAHATAAGLGTAAPAADGAAEPSREELEQDDLELVDAEDARAVEAAIALPEEARGDAQIACEPGLADEARMAEAVRGLDDFEIL